MIIFTGSGRSGTGLYAKLFNGHHEHRVGELMDLVKAQMADFNNPETDPLKDPEIRFQIVKKHFENEDLAEFCDSSNGYIHFPDALHRLNPGIKIVVGMRDGRDFARSGITRGYHTDRYHLFSMVPEKDDPIYPYWDRLSPIQKMAWMWNYRNCKVLQRLQDVPNENWAIVRLEDLTDGTPKSEAVLTQLENFVGRKADRQWATVKYNAQKTPFALPPKEEWTDDMNQQFAEIAGPLMSQLRYEIPGYKPPGAP